MPSASHGPYQKVHGDKFALANAAISETDPSQKRWIPLAIPGSDQQVTFLEGLRRLCGAGEPTLKDGLSIYLYAFNADSGNQAFYSADGDWLIVPQLGDLHITTELGRLIVSPLEICVIPRGIKFKVDVAPGADGKQQGRGYICETYKGHFVLPDLGPIGSNSLANPMHFETPTSWYHDNQEEWTIVSKYADEFFTYQQDHSPFDVVAWHGNYAPYKYDLNKFNTVGSISYDHPDPSIFTVLTC